jgi:hypothetical protein
MIICWIMAGVTDWTGGWALLCQRWRANWDSICCLCFLGRSSRAFFDDMTIFFAVVAEFSRTICNIMTKSLTTKTLNSAHIPTSWLTLCCIGHRNRCRSSLFHGGLSEKALFFAKEVTEACIQGGNKFSVHQVGFRAFKFRS